MNDFVSLSDLMRDEPAASQSATGLAPEPINETDEAAPVSSVSRSGDAEATDDAEASNTDSVDDADSGGDAEVPHTPTAIAATLKTELDNASGLTVENVEEVESAKPNIDKRRALLRAQGLADDVIDKVLPIMSTTRKTQRQLPVDSTVCSAEMIAFSSPPSTSSAAARWSARASIRAARSTCACASSRGSEPNAPTLEPGGGAHELRRPLRHRTALTVRGRSGRKPNEACAQCSGHHRARRQPAPEAKSYERGAFWNQRGRHDD